MDTRNNNFIICENCFKSEYIKNYIKKKKIEKVGQCCLCGQRGVDISKDASMLQMLTNIIKYNYPIYKYLSKADKSNFFIGKTNLEDILVSDNELFEKIEDERKLL